MALRFGSFSIAGCAPFAGLIVDEDEVVAISALAAPCRARGLPLHGAETIDAMLGDWDRNIASIRQLLADGHDPQPRARLDQLRRHAPVAAPRQIICSGANYRKHVIDLLAAQGGGAATEGLTAAQRRAWAAEVMDRRAATGTPYAFVKAASALAGPDDPLVIPGYSAECDWELELAVVIGKAGFRVGREDAWDHVGGFMIVNDITARDFVYRQDDMKVLGTDWLASKSAPGFLPAGPYLVPRGDVADWAALTIRLTLNGQVMQDESTADMIFDIPRQIEHISRYVPLTPGDVICTGSPAGNGAHHGRHLRAGDVMEGSITGLGTQHVRCMADMRG